MLAQHSLPCPDHRGSVERRRDGRQDQNHRHYHHHLEQRETVARVARPWRPAGKSYHGVLDCAWRATFHEGAFMPRWRNFFSSAESVVLGLCGLCTCHIRARALGGRYDLTSKTFKSRRVPTPGTLPYLLLLLTVLFHCRGFAALRYPLGSPAPRPSPEVPNHYPVQDEVHCRPLRGRRGGQKRDRLPVGAVGERNR